MAQIERKYLVHYLNATPASTATWCRLGKDLEEFSVELSPEIETKKNILGESSTNLSAYEASASVDPYYADKDDPLYDFLQDIIDGRKTLDACKTEYLEVQTWKEAIEGKYVAYKESVIVEISSYGGDTTAYAIPFTLHMQGDRVKGTFDPDTKTFTVGA